MNNRSSTKSPNELQVTTIHNPNVPTESRLVLDSRADYDTEIELDCLTQIICDSLRPTLGCRIRLQSSSARNGLQSITHVFSAQTRTSHPYHETQLRMRPSEIGHAQAHVLERLTQEVERLLTTRLAIEAERLGYHSGRLSW